MKSTLGIMAIALLIGAGGLAPREVYAQGACEAAGAFSVGIAGAAAVGALGETVTGSLDRATAQIEQAEAGGPEAQPGVGENDEAAAPPPPRPAANEPPPQVSGC